MYFTSNDRSRNMFGYQPTTLDKGNDYVISWKLKGVYISKPKPL